MLDFARENLLSQFGLRSVMHWRERGGCDYDERQFIPYRSSSYDNSEHLDADEVYRMKERVLLHRATGFRATYLISSNYNDDEEKFTFLRGNIITLEGLHIEVKGIEEGGFRTPQGLIPFDAVRKEHFVGDA